MNRAHKTNNTDHENKRPVEIWVQLSIDQNQDSTPFHVSTAGGALQYSDREHASSAEVYQNGLGVSEITIK